MLDSLSGVRFLCTIGSIFNCSMQKCSPRIPCLKARSIVPYDRTMLITYYIKVPVFLKVSAFPAAFSLQLKYLSS